MKRKISVFLTIFLVGFHSISFAETSCVTGYALEMAIADQTHRSDLDYCSTATLPGPCQAEANAKHNQAVNTAFVNYNACCCMNSLSCCN